MTQADMLEIVTWLFTSYVGGWTSGYIFYVFKRLADFI